MRKSKNCQQLAAGELGEPYTVVGIKCFYYKEIFILLFQMTLQLFDKFSIQYAWTK